MNNRIFNFWSIIIGSMFGVNTYHFPIYNNNRDALIKLLNCGSVYAKFTVFYILNFIQKF